MSTEGQAITADSMGGLAAANRVEAGTALPWYCWAIVLAGACIPIGVLWDISWHVTIGRDTFWTPAHGMIYIGGALPGCLAGWLVLKQTFWTAPANRIPTVRVWGFHGPIGAWVVIWGAFTMLVSAPFDNWWHNAYGLDVQILSPPHTLLALGTYSVAIGGLLLIVSWHNRAEGASQAATTLLFLFACGVLLTKVSVFLTEYTYPNQQHGAAFYRAACLNFPLWMVVAARASGRRWAATGTALVYMFIVAFMLWVLPLFPAQAKLAPIYNPVTHMVPPPFPLLLVVPAIGIDILLRAKMRRGFWTDTALALAVGVFFFLLLIGTQWLFSEFLLSPMARNPFFGGNAMWGYNDKLGDWCTEFWVDKGNVLTPAVAGIAILYAAIQTRIALWFGNWLSKVRR